MLLPRVASWRLARLLAVAPHRVPLLAVLILHLSLCSCCFALTLSQLYRHTLLFLSLLLLLLLRSSPDVSPQFADKQQRRRLAPKNQTGRHTRNFSKNNVQQLRRRRRRRRRCRRRSRQIMRFVLVVAIFAPLGSWGMGSNRLDDSARRRLAVFLQCDNFKQFELPLRLNGGVVLDVCHSTRRSQLGNARRRRVVCISFWSSCRVGWG